jgi:hypothetical protein
MPPSRLEVARGIRRRWLPLFSSGSAGRLALSMSVALSGPLVRASQTTNIHTHKVRCHGRMVLLTKCMLGSIVVASLSQNGDVTSTIKVCKRQAEVGALHRDLTLFLCTRNDGEDYNLRHSSSIESYARYRLQSSEQTVIGH